MANTDNSKKSDTKVKSTTAKDKVNSKANTVSKNSSTVKKNSVNTSKIKADKADKADKVIEDKKVNKSINTSKIISIILILASILIIALSVSFGFFTYSRTGTKPSTVYTANLNIVVNDEESLGINEDNAFPVYDQVGRETDPYEFTLENLGSVAANYVMRLVPDQDAIDDDMCSDNLIAEESLKIQLIKDGTVVKEERISQLDDYVIDSGFIGLVDGVNSYSYELRIWITSDAGKEVMGRHYHGKIQVDVVDPNNS